MIKWVRNLFYRSIKSLGKSKKKISVLISCNIKNKMNIQTSTHETWILMYTCARIYRSTSNEHAMPKTLA